MSGRAAGWSGWFLVGVSRSHWMSVPFPSVLLAIANRATHAVEVELQSGSDTVLRQVFWAWRQSLFRSNVTPNMRVTFVIGRALPQAMGPNSISECRERKAPPP